MIKALREQPKSSFIQAYQFNANILLSKIL